VKIYKPVLTGSRIILQFLLVAAAAVLAGCAGPAGTVPPMISVQVAPTTANVATGQTQQFMATVTGTTNTAVTWQVSSTSASAASIGTINASGLYTAPPNAPTGGTVTVTATAQADTTKTGTAVANVTAQPAVTVTVSPKTPTVGVGLTQQFTATVANTSNTAVTWQVNNVTGGSTTTGTISTTGLYTAPATVPSAAVMVKAISMADAAKSDTAAVTITLPMSVSVTVSPKTPSVQVALTQQFTATVANTSNTAVTWQVNNVTGGNATTGTISTTGLFTAPTTVPAPNPVTVKAISVADNTKSDTATVTIAPAPNVTVAISPKRGGLTAGQRITFTPTVTGSTNMSVSWEVDGVPGGSITVGLISAGGVYTAPNSGGVHNIVARSAANTAATSAATPIGVTDLAGVFTYHNNNNRDGVNSKEYALTAANVTAATFGRLFSCPVDAAVYAQPLWVANVTINSVKHNILIALTQHDTVYAFDADVSPCQTLWTKTLLGVNETYGQNMDVSCDDLAPDIGIVGTPVIDSATNTLYLVTKSKTPPSTTIMFTQRIHALSLIDGSEKFGGPTAIAGTINGNSFSAFRNNQRAGLALVNGKVYVAQASHCDQASYQGWVFGYTASDLTVAPDVFTPAAHMVGVESGIWMAGGAPASDANNNLYLITGNGTFDANSATPPNDDYGDSILKLGTTGGISVSDYFTPSDQASLQSADADLGSGGAAVLVDQTTGPHAHYLIGGGKEGIIYLLNRDNLGHFSSTDSGVLQMVGTGGAIFATPAFWQNKMFIAGAVGTTSLQSFTFTPSTGQFATPSASTSSDSYAFPGATPSISARPDGSNGIAWAINSSTNGTGGSSFGAAVLRAYDATNLATELWTSSDVTADKAGNAVKFTVPTIANGKVYIGTRGNNTGGAASSTSTPGEIDVYGLKPN
jgi:hypothetical protein